MNSEPCPNCKESIEQCACIRNKCNKCGNPVGNITFSVCDDCWDRKEEMNSEELKQDLLPCPFCGSNKIMLGHVRESDDDNFVDYEYLCLDCNAAGGLSQSKGEALDSWNTRTPELQNLKLCRCSDDHAMTVQKINDDFWRHPGCGGLIPNKPGLQRLDEDLVAAIIRELDPHGAPRKLAKAIVAKFGTPPLTKRREPKWPELLDKNDTWHTPREIRCWNNAIEQCKKAHLASLRGEE